MSSTPAQLLAKIAAIKDPVITLTGPALQALIGSLFTHPGKATLFAAQYQSVSGVLGPDGKRIWDFRTGMPNKGDQTWQFEREGEASDVIDTVREETASLDNARTE